MSIKSVAGQPVASRIYRLAGALVDGTLLGVITWGLLFWIIKPSSIEETATSTSEGMSFQLVGLAFLLTQATYLALNGYLLSKRGQTIGKWLLGIRVVSLDSGQIPGLGISYGVRFLLTSIMGSIPLIGILLQFVNLIAIFGGDRRCFHDLIARTAVVRVQ